MKILFLDDEDWRHTMIEAHAGKKHDLWHVWTAEEAIHAINNADPPFNVVSLDHDLGANKTEGRLVSQYLRTVSRVWPDKRLPKLVIVHSWNAPAARMMLEDLLDATLKDVVYAPFSTFNYADIGITPKPAEDPS